MKKKITVLGAGSWGTALAHVQAKLEHSVTLWDRKAETIAEINQSHENRKYHPGIRLSENIRGETNLQKAVSNADIVILSVPSHAIEETLQNAGNALGNRSILIDTAKGLDTKALETISSVVARSIGKDQMKKRYAVLSGPSFAFEVVRGLPTAVTVAAFNSEVTQEVQRSCHTDHFQLFTSEDVTGVEIAGALKNVIAVVTGVADGFSLGNNARAALITRGLKEISRIGQALGAHPLTFSGLAGLGDLILTCTGDLSRNRRVGIKMAEGKTLRTIMKEVGQVAEGIRTTKAAYLLAKKLNVNVPILTEAYLAMYEGKSPRKAVSDLLSRAPEAEQH